MNGRKLFSSTCCALLLVTSPLMATAVRAADEEKVQATSALVPDLLSLADTNPLSRTAARAADDEAKVPEHNGLVPDLVSLADNNSARIALTGSNTTYSTALTPGALEAAELMGISPYVQRVIALRQGGSREFGKMSDEEMALRVDLMDRILGEILEVRVVSDRIDRNLSWAWSNKGMLEGKRQKELNMLFTANFMQGGVLGILSGPAFLHGRSATGTELLLLASSIGLALSLASFAVARSGSRPIDSETTVLADVFGLSYSGQLHHPERVTKFLNSVPPGSTTGKTRKEELIAGWERGKYLKSLEEKNLLRVASVQPQSDKYKENIGMIANRIRLLYDSQNAIAQLDGELLDLLRALE